MVAPEVAEATTTFIGNAFDKNSPPSGLNVGVATNPIVGIPLPLMSYGGSAIIINLVALAVVLRIDYENRTLMHGGRV